MAEEKRGAVALVSVLFLAHRTVICAFASWFSLLSLTGSCSSALLPEPFTPHQQLQELQSAQVVARWGGKPPAGFNRDLDGSPVLRVCVHAHTCAWEGLGIAGKEVGRGE